jgi:hypothetical protein
VVGSLKAKDETDGAVRVPELKIILSVTKSYTVELTWEHNSTINNSPLFKQGFTEPNPILLGLLMDTVALG